MAVFLSFSRSNSPLAGFGGIFADSHYHHCRHCNDETFAIPVCRMDVVWDNHCPVIGIIQISISAPYAMADRYHYLPSIGLAVMMAWGNTGFD